MGTAFLTHMHHIYITYTYTVMGTAFLTATLCQFSDLNSAESWMIRILDRKRLSQMQRHSVR